MATLPPIEIDVRADTGQAEAGLDRVGDAAERAGQRTERGADAAARGSRNLGGASRAMRGNLQNTSFQLQDMVVQLQMGTNWTTVMAQQLPQLAGGFGAVGAAIGVLLAVGFTGLGFAMRAAGNDTRSFQEILEDLEEAMGKYRNAVDLANASTDELRERFGSASTELQNTIALLEQIAANEAQRAIDDLSNSLAELLGTGGAGESRTVLADFFDVNIGLAFTDLQREARSEARLLTAEFENQQDQLRASAGDLEAQMDVLSAMVGTAQQLAAANGEVTAEEEAVIKKLADALLLMQEQKETVQDTVGSVALITDAMSGVTSAIDTALGRATSLRDMFIEAALALPNAHDIINKSFALRGEVGRGGAGPGGPTSVADEFIASTGGIQIETEEEEKKRTGRAEPKDTTESDLEALQKRLMSETELIQSSYADRHELLIAAREQQLLTEEQYNEMLLQIEKDKNDKLAALDAYRYGSGLDRTQQFLGDTAAALAGGNEKMIELSQKFAKVEALINAGRAFAQVAADPTLPWYAKIPAAVGVAAAISSFSSQAGIGGGGGGAAVSGPTQDQQQQAAPTQQRSITLIGDRFNRQQAIEIAEFMNEGTDDGLVIRGRR